MAQYVIFYDDNYIHFCSFIALPSSAFRFPIRGGGTVETGCTGISVELGLVTKGYKSLLLLNGGKNKPKNKKNKYVLQFFFRMLVIIPNKQQSAWKIVLLPYHWNRSNSSDCRTNGTNTRWRYV